MPLEKYIGDVSIEGENGRRLEALAVYLLDFQDTPGDDRDPPLSRLIGCQFVKLDDALARLPDGSVDDPTDAELALLEAAAKDKEAVLCSN